MIGTVGSADKAKIAKKAGAQPHDPLPRGGFRQAGRRDHQGRRNARSSTTASARRPSRPRSTASSRSAMFASYGSAFGRDRGVRHRPARRERARCSRPGRPCSPSWPTARGSRRWRATSSGSVGNGDVKIRIGRKLAARRGGRGAPGARGARDDGLDRAVRRERPEPAAAVPSLAMIAPTSPPMPARRLARQAAPI